MADETRKEPGAMRKIQLGVIALGAIAILIVIFQNTAPVETTILFITITMPRALLLFVTLVIGFALGVLTSLSASRKRRRGE